MSKLVPILLIVGSALLQAGSAALIKFAMKMKNAEPGRKIYRLVYILALVLYGPSFILWAEGLSKMNLAVAQPAFSGSMFIFTILMSLLLFKEKIKPYKYLGFLSIIGGIVVLVL